MVYSQYLFKRRRQIYRGDYPIRRSWSLHQSPRLSKWRNCWHCKFLSIILQALIFSKQAVWFIRNLVTGSRKYIELCLEKRLLEKLIKKPYESEIRISTLGNIIYAISNLCKGKQKSQIRPALKLLHQMIAKREEKELVLSGLGGIIIISSIIFQSFPMISPYRWKSSRSHWWRLCWTPCRIHVIHKEINFSLIHVDVIMTQTYFSQQWRYWETC